MKKTRTSFIDTEVKTILFVIFALKIPFRCQVSVQTVILAGPLRPEIQSTMDE